jgi:predicted porin
MKKRLIVAAMAAAFATPTIAQVTISGTIGAGFTATGNSVGLNDSQVIDNGANGYSTPVIQLSGREDLGGGLTASFVLQGALNANGSVGNSAFTPADAAIFNRQAYIQVGKSDLGNVRLGRTSDVIESGRGVPHDVGIQDALVVAEGFLSKNDPGSLRALGRTAAAPAARSAR